MYFPLKFAIYFTYRFELNCLLIVPTLSSRKHVVDRCGAPFVYGIIGKIPDFSLLSVSMAVGIAITITVAIAIINPTFLQLFRQLSFRPLLFT